MHLDQFFLLHADGAHVVAGSYQPGLVVLSVLVAIGLSLIGLHAAYIALETRNPVFRHTAVGLGALALGAGIWTMHFIGMLAFRLPVNVHYDPLLTGLSSVAAIGASWLALYMLARQHISWWQLSLSGLLVGAGIGVMHYTGMMAMDTPLKMRFVPSLFVLSVVVAAVLAMLALWIRFGVHRLRFNQLVRYLISGVVMGGAISGMHYTGMAAVRFLGHVSAPDAGADTIHVGVVVASLVLSSVTITAGLMVAALNGAIRSRELYKKVQASESRMRAVFNTAVDAIVLTDGYGAIEAFSPAAERLFGYTADEVMGRNINMLMPEPDHSRHDDYLRRYRETGEKHIIGVGARVDGLRKDGSCVPIRIAIGQVDVPGRYLFVGLLSDMTERVKLEDSLRATAHEAQQAALAKSQFLANMSHEIRTPMNSIIGFTELSLQTVLDDTQRRYLETIQRSSQSLLQLINDILDTSKIEHGKVQLERRDFSLNELAYQIESSLSAVAQSRNISFSVHYPATMPPYFVGDSLRILQIVTNLAGNAVKFTEQGGVDVSFSYEQEQVHIRVSDSGIGMSEEQIAHIFEPFTQADASMRRRFGGTGLGTTIALQLVEVMGGRIHVDSVLGEGSTFHVHLPLPVGEKPAQTLAQTHADLPPLRVLIADDIEQNLELLRITLENQHHQTVSARDGADAVAKFKAEPFDVVLMDVHMPDTDGLQATRHIRHYENEHQRERTPIIALTASVMARDRRRALDAGMDGFAIKPLDTPKLFAEMARVLNAPSQGGIEASAAMTPPFEQAVATIDWQRGLSAWGGQAHFVKQLGRFFDALDDDYPLLATATASVDTQALVQTLHGLRGASGNLALMAVSHCAGRLEEQCREQGAEAVVEPLLELTELLSQARKEYESAATDAAREGVCPTPVDMSATAWSEALGALLVSVEQSEIDDTLTQHVLDQLGQLADHGQRQRQLDAALDNFDFSTAAQLLRTWLDEADAGTLTE